MCGDLCECTGKAGRQPVPYTDLELLSRRYPSVSPDESEPGPIRPSDDPLLVYYRGYCRQELGQPEAADFGAASQMPLLYVFPNEPDTVAVLRAALASNPSDASARAGNRFLFDQPRSAALIAAGAASALLLAQLDRFQSRITPLTLRICADLVLLSPVLVFASVVFSPINQPPDFNRIARLYRLDGNGQLRPMAQMVPLRLTHTHRRRTSVLDRSLAARGYRRKFQLPATWQR